MCSNACVVYPMTAASSICRFFCLKWKKILCNTCDFPRQYVDFVSLLQKCYSIKSLPCQAFIYIKCRAIDNNYNSLHIGYVLLRFLLYTINIRICYVQCVDEISSGMVEVGISFTSLCTLHWIKMSCFLARRLYLSIFELEFGNILKIKNSIAWCIRSS